MIRLTKSTYAQIAHLIQDDVWLSGPRRLCDVCAQESRSLIEADCAWWCLCEYHAREVGVLW